MSDMYMHACTKSFLKTTTNSSCVCTHLANKADSDLSIVLAGQTNISSDLQVGGGGGAVMA